MSSSNSNSNSILESNDQDLGFDSQTFKKSSSLSNEESLRTLEGHIKTLNRNHNMLETRVADLEKRRVQRCATCYSTDVNLMADCAGCHNKKKFDEFNSSKIYTIFGTVFCTVVAIVVIGEVLNFKKKV